MLLIERWHAVELHRVDDTFKLLSKKIILVAYKLQNYTNAYDVIVIQTHIN
jgi:hypothetical protein